MDALKKITVEKDITLAQLAFAWLLSKGEDIISLIGSTRMASLQNSVKSLDVNLSESDVKRIENAIPENEIAGNSRDMVFRNGKVVQVL
ncbi:MAG: aldo/keto reductase [Sebaldella sp.]|nr:aldo/keto reductase [Sebaldella sp.]